LCKEAGEEKRAVPGPGIIQLATTSLSMEPLGILGSPQRNRASSVKSSTKRTALVVGVSAFVFVALIALLSIVLVPTTATADSVTFFVVGDWGREGTANQTSVAALMSQVATQLAVPPVAVISTGDNFYPNGLNSTVGIDRPTCARSSRALTLSLALRASLVRQDDPLFDRSFRSVYNGKGVISLPWYAVLGNHDYGDGFWTLCEKDASLVGI